MQFCAMHSDIDNAERRIERLGVRIKVGQMAVLEHEKSLFPILPHTAKLAQYALARGPLAAAAATTHR